MKLNLHKGTTAKLLDLFVQDNSVATGAGLTGLAFNTAGLTAYYYREGAGAAVAITLATMTLGTWSSGGFVALDGTNLPGIYQLGIPDAALVSGANSVLVMLKGAANMAVVLLEIQLTDTDVHDPVRFGLTALPNAAAGATGGLDCMVSLGGTAAAGTATTITLTGGVATDNYYNHQVVQITGGTGVGQARIIVGYVGSTKVATLSRAWTTNPDSTSLFQVKGLETTATWQLAAGTLSAATATTATLAGAVATNGLYNGALLVITAGTGQRQARVITGYVGGTLVATVDRAWATTPDNTSVYVVYGADLPGADGAGNLTGSVASVTGNVGGNVIGSVASVTAAVDLLQSAADKVWSSAARTLTAFSTALGQAVWDVLQSAVTVASSMGLLVKNNLDTNIGSRLATSGYTTPPTAQQTATQVWSEPLPGAFAAGAAGQKMDEINGLLGKFSGLRNTVYTSGNLTSYDLCLYDTLAHAATNDGATGLLHKYSVLNSYDGSGNLTSSVTTRVS